MAIPVGELVSIPSLGTRVIAGERGLANLISWAHVCELNNPWEWFGPGELLMTTGLGVPAGADEQAAYVQNMAQAGCAGMAVGDAMYAPTLTDELVSTANTLSFPVLLTERDVPFMALARAVAGASAREVRARLAATERIYQHTRTLSSDEDPSFLIAALGKELGHDLLVFEGRQVLSGQGIRGMSDDPLFAVLQAGFATSGEPGSLTRLPEPFGSMAITLPPPNAGVLFVVPHSGGRIDIGLVQHAAAAIAVQRAAATAGLERGRRLGSALFSRLVDETIDWTVAGDELADRSLSATRLVLATEATDTPEWSDLHYTLDSRALPNLLLRRNGKGLALVPAASEAVSVIADHLPEAFRVGVSEPFEHALDTRTAMVQALWALEHESPDEQRVTCYTRNAGWLALLPSTQADRERLARRVLAPLFAYDETKAGRLVSSLLVFLEENRSWQRAAPRLQVHKQTLVYRMERVEQLTGRRLNSTADVAELWIALQAGRASGLIS